MVRKKVAVLGWYNKGNLGDESFKPAFRAIWPNIDFEFVETIPQHQNAYDALWVGGGSVLDNPVFALDKVTIPLGFIGVGVGKPLTGVYAKAAAKAKMIIVRDKLSAELIPGSVQMPDLVFATDFPVKGKPIPKQVTILVNDFMTPKYNSAEWTGLSYHWFSHEFGKCCDELMENGYQLNFVPMGTGVIDDRRAAAPIISKLKKPGHVVWHLPDDNRIFQYLAESELVISQRFHGLVFAAQLGRRCIAISAHDKISGLMEEFEWKDSLVDFYGFNYHAFKKVLENALNKDPKTLLAYADKAKDSWKCMSATVEERFFG